MSSRDPVAEKSKFLCMYMSSHPDTLVAYVRHWGKVKEHVVSAEMASIDSKGMTLGYKTRGSDATKSVRVTFDPPLAGYEEVKPRLLGMTADAQEALGMTKRPQITTFRLPRTVLIPGIPLLAQIYVTFAPAYTGPLYAPGRYLNRRLGGILTALWLLVFVAHTLEALYAVHLCVRHRTPLLIGLQYVLATCFFGGPILIELRSTIQAARIDSIMKGN